MKYFWLFCFVLLFVSEEKAQSVFVPTDSAFMTFENNIIIFPNGNSLPLFYEKLDRLLFDGEGYINILHIGGSHVQAGVFTESIRNNLLSAYPHINSGLGIIFPFSAAKTNNPHPYKTTYQGKWSSYRNVNKEIVYPLGLNGILLVSQDEEAAFSISMRKQDSLRFDFNIIRLLGYCDSGRVKPYIHTAKETVEGVYDSVSKSYLFVLTEYVDSFSVSFHQVIDSLWEPFYIRGLLLDNQLPGITYHSVGVNGASVPSYLKCDYLEKDLAFIKPDLCVFAIGINDASGDSFDTVAFKQNYDALIRRIRSVSPDCEFVFITNNDSYQRHRRKYHNNANGLLAKQAFYQLAEKYHAGVWDLFTLMGGLRSMKQWEAQGLAQRDKVHFTSQGYKLLGNLFYNALISDYINHLHKEIK